jgi:hypothetical protein
MTHDNIVARQWAERYTLGELSEGDRQVFETHYFDCAECAADVRAAFMFRDNAAAVLRENPVVAAEPKPGWLDWLQAAWLKPAFSMPFAVMFLLWAGTAYQLRTARTSTQVVAGYSLMPDVRGNEAVRQTGGFIGLELHGFEQIPGPYQWEIRPAEGGEVVESGQSPAPPKDYSLSFRIPSSRLKAGSYHLTLSGQSGAPQQKLTYQFEIQKE